MLSYKLENDTLLITIPTMSYREEVLFKCFYWYTANYNVQINPLDGISTLVSLRSKNNAIEPLDGLIETIQRDLIDFKLRDIVTKETQSIRELIIAKAFAYADFTQNPASAVSDPVGFDPLLVR